MRRPSAVPAVYGRPSLRVYQPAAVREGALARDTPGHARRESLAARAGRTVLTAGRDGIRPLRARRSVRSGCSTRGPAARTQVLPGARVAAWDCHLAGLRHAFERMDTRWARRLELAPRRTGDERSARRGPLLRPERVPALAALPGRRGRRSSRAGSPVLRTPRAADPARLLRRGGRRHGPDGTAAARPAPRASLSRLLEPARRPAPTVQRRVVEPRDRSAVLRRAPAPRHSRPLGRRPAARDRRPARLGRLLRRLPARGARPSELCEPEHPGGVSLRPSAVLPGRRRRRGGVPRARRDTRRAARGRAVHACRGRRSPPAAAAPAGDRGLRAVGAGDRSRSALGAALPGPRSRDRRPHRRGAPAARARAAAGEASAGEPRPRGLGVISYSVYLIHLP